MFFFFNDTATTEIYTLSLHDALPIFVRSPFAALTLPWGGRYRRVSARLLLAAVLRAQDRKSTRLNSSHANISYAVFCLKKKKTKRPRAQLRGTYSRTSTQSTLDIQST